MNKITVLIRGMHCASCELLVSGQLKKIHGVKTVHVSQKRGLADITYTGNRPNSAAITQAVQEAGYEIGDKQKLPLISRNGADYKDLAKAAVIVLMIYFFAQRFGLFSMDVGASKSGVAVALLVGLVAGVSTCMALVGGLVLSLSARHAEQHPEATPLQKFRPHIYFNIGRIVGYAFLGGVIGLIGKAFNPSANVLGIVTMLIGGVMIFFGLKLIEIFPILRDKNITLPKGIARLFGLQGEVKEYSRKGALVMGTLTFFIPCGFTQAMQLYAVSTGSFWHGMAIMGLFALGTAPGLLGIGGLTSVFKGRRARLLFMTAGLAVIFLGWFNITNGSRLFSLNEGNSALSSVNSDKQEYVVRMTQDARGYSPNSFTVEKGRPIKWIINSTSSFTCAASLVMPAYGISRTLRPGENIITFTPTKIGEIPFSCSMGMYRGKFIVVESKTANSAISANSATGSIGKAAPICGSGGCSGCGGGSSRNVKPQEGAVEKVPAEGYSISNSDVEQVLKTVYTYDNDIIPNTFTVKKGRPVRFAIDVKENGYGCMSTIMIPGLYNTPKLLNAGNPIVMTFTPKKTGSYPITCAMGVPRGEIKVVD